ncbi:MAG: Gldg family protein [Rhodospirillales bacterium]|nr:Gldg family protein [Rhodospirillales bacterium]
MAIAGLCVAAVLFLAVNVLANAEFRGAQVDLTEGNLYTVAQGTRQLLGSLDEPVQLRLYFTPRLGEVAPRYAAYDARVRELLERYVTMSNGKLQLQMLEPEPFSDAEDRAVADGLQGVPLSQSGEQGYFGLAGSNAEDGRAVIPFFNLERESFLEYDLTKLIYGLANSKRPTLGVISALPNDMPGGHPAATPPPLMIFDHIRDFFTVEDLEVDVAEIPSNIDVLLVLDLNGVSDQTVRAIDRFVHDGGKALVFVDPLIESSGGRPKSEEAAPAEDVTALLKAWGIEEVDGKVAGDLDAARRVSTSNRAGGAGDYLPWLTLGRTNVDEGDPVMANVERLNLASAGILQSLGTAGLTVTPLISTGPRSMPIDVEKVRGTMPDIMGLLASFKSSGKPLMLAARISGNAPEAFSADAEAAAPEKPASGKTPEVSGNPGTAPDTASDGKAASPAADVQPERKPIQVIVVADADMLYDRFWVQSSDFFGERVDVPTASNADFVINALENLADADALVGLRGRGTSYRPFTLVEELRRDAEARYRAKEQELQQRLSEIQQQLEGIQQRGGAQGEGAQGGELLLSAEDKAAIERFRGEMLSVRKDLRDVQHALRSDIERLEDRVKFINIAAVPIFLCGIGGVMALVRRAKRSRAKRQTKNG